MIKKLNPEQIKSDVLGGITAGIVALPLALAFGETSGIGPMAGLWGAIIVGFFAALFGGTNTQISGPTGPMVVVFTAAMTLLSNDPALIFSSVMLAGLFLILFGVFGIGKYIRLVPYAVISGFMSGIGCIIILLQLSSLLGINVEGKGVVHSTTLLLYSLNETHTVTAIIGIASLAIVFLWPKSWAKILPGALGALIICTVMSTFTPGVSTLGTIPMGFPELIVPELSQDKLFLILKTALVLAVLCAIDSLLTSLVADNLTQTRHHSNKELIGQGVGNFVAGLFGSLPGAGATMRTVVNIRSGGQTKLSGMVHSLFLLSVVLVLAPLASKIPHTVLAGILLKVGYDIIDWDYLKKAHKGPKWDLFLMLTVLLLTVFFDLILAVSTGVVLAALAFVKKTADKQLASLNTNESSNKNPDEKQLLQQLNQEALIFDVPMPLSFAATSELAHFVRERTKDYRMVIINFEEHHDICLSTAKAIEVIVEQSKTADQHLFISGINEKIEKILANLGIHSSLPKSHWFITKRLAMEFAISKIRP